MRSRCLVTLLALTAFCAGSAHASPVAPKARKIIEPFDYRGVTLDDGSMRRQFDETRDYYLRIPNDDLLKGFRERAGKPAPGETLPGWYGNDVFHIFGQIISGLSRMYAATGDPACREKVHYLIEEWAKCIADDGYFFSSAKPNAPYYVYDKTICGLIDAHLYCGNRESLRHLGTITEWAMRNMPAPDEEGFNARLGGEWYTLSENLYRAYLTTGDPRYRDFAKKWEFTAYWKHYADETDIFADRQWYHAYSHLNTLSGAAAAYAVTGDRWYLDAILKGHDYFRRNQCYATGGYGPDERLRRPEELPDTLDTSIKSFETQCGSWAAFKLCKYLMSFTGDARYGDWVEQLVINGTGASIPMSSDGKPFYYADYNISGASKHLHPGQWACCAGTRPQAIADYYDLVYFRGANDLYVNLFTPSTVRWAVGGRKVTVRQTTRFPERDTVEFTVSVDRPAAFGIRVRAPSWTRGRQSARINGTPVSAEPDALNWMVFRREWRNGDKLAVKMPMVLTMPTFPASSSKPYPAAVLYGPVTLAFRSPGGNPSAWARFGEPLDDWLRKVPGEPLTFRMIGGRDVLARPFYAFEEGERYYVYLDPSNTWTRYSHKDVQFTGEWGDAGEFRMSRFPGSTAEFSFRGTGIRWAGFRFDDAGIVEVRLDGELVDTVDQYAPGRAIPFRWERKDLPAGKHTLRLTLKEGRNPKSKDRYVNVAGFDTLAE